VDRPTLTAGRPSVGALVLALAVPPLFLHARYSPGFSVSVGSTSLSVELADLAVLAVAIAAVVVARRDGLGSLRGGRTLWIATAAYLGLVLAGTLYGPAVTDGYPLASSLVSAAKYAEYGVLALAVPLLVRRASDLAALFLSLVVWSTAATGWGLLQFLGLVDEFEGRRPGQRETSFLGVHDFAALSAAALSLALVAVAFGPRGRRERQLAWLAAGAGTLGVVLSGALASVGAVLLGTVVVAAAAWGRGALTRIRALALVGIAATVLAGSLAIRSADLDQLLRFVGISPQQEETTGNVQSYAQRTVLGYIGIRIFLDHPLLGVGWQGSALEPSYRPYLDDARRRYPSVSAESLPSPEHPWGVQNAFIQAAADLGVLGLLALLGLLAAGMWTALTGYERGPPEALVPFLWLIVAAAELTALGLFAGVPVDALLWLALGLAVASRRVWE
jgi:hypothetical protein